MGFLKKLAKAANPVSALKKTDPLAKKVLNSKVGKTLTKADPMLARANKASMPAKPALKQMSSAPARVGAPKPRVTKPRGNLY